MIRAIVTDIEGTTSSVSFVHEVLFPYAAEHLPAFVLQRAAEAEVGEQLDETRRLAGTPDVGLNETIDILLQWISEDRKATPLKALQGMIWRCGYERGDFTGHVHADAVEQLRRWHAQGIALYIYSSGSVGAQQLLFRHTDWGDLTPLFSGYFDTRIGNKRETDAYQTIAATLKLPANDILFLSDLEAELDAAHSVGMATCWLAREDNPPAHLPGEQPGHPVAREFSEITLD